MFAQVLVTEFVKLRRSKVTWATLAALSMATLGVALFMWIVREPGRAAQFGLLGAKADLSGLTATWPSFLGMFTLILGIGGMLVLPFIVAFIFGREYSEQTAKNMLALPVARSSFVIAKLIVAAVWWLVLVFAVLAEAFVVGFLLGLPGFSAGLAIAALRNTLLAAGISYLLVPLVAWITLIGRGYMAPLGFALAMMALGDVVSKTGWAPYFPYSIVPLLVGVVGTPAAGLPMASFAVLALTFITGIAATIAQLVYADNTQ
ncbi:MAG: ABC transporter permease [Coriobacteriia bacterium]